MVSQDQAVETGILATGAILGATAGKDLLTKTFPLADPLWGTVVGVVGLFAGAAVGAVVTDAGWKIVKHAPIVKDFI